MTEPNNLDPLILDGQAIARDLGINPGVIRNWASAGRITRQGVDERGRALYDYDQVKAFADSRSLRGEQPARDDGLATVAQLARQLGRSTRVVHGWARLGHITVRKLDERGHQLFDVDEAKAYAATLVRRVTSDEVATPRRAPNTCRRLPTDWWPGKA